MSQQNPNPQPDDVRPPPAKSRKRHESKPFVIEYKGKTESAWLVRLKDWRVFARYHTAEQRAQALDGFRRKYPFYEYRTLDLTE